MAYRSTHGDVQTAPEEIFRLLDTILERRLTNAFRPQGRWHWQDLGHEDRPPPDGLGSYGSGFRALGSRGERIDLRWEPSADLFSPYDEIAEPPDDELDADPFGEDGDLLDCDPYDPDDERYVNDNGYFSRAPQPWKKVLGDDRALHEWLVGRMRWRGFNDGHFTSDPRTQPERIRFAEYDASRRDLADRLLTAFPQDRSRYFRGEHAWKRWHEDPLTRDEEFLSRDEVIAFVSGGDVAMLWLYFYRWYG